MKKICISCAFVYNQQLESDYRLRGSASDGRAFFVLVASRSALHAQMSHYDGTMRT